MSFSFLFASFLAVALGLAALPAAAADSPAGDPVVARVNGQELHRSDVDAAVKTLPAQARAVPMERLYPILIEHMVDAALVTDAGRKQHLDQDPDVKRQLKRDEDRLIDEAFLKRAIDKAASDSALKARYQVFLKEKGPQEEVHARHILVKTEAEAKSIIEQLQKGADFAALAKKYSTDPEAASGGDLGYFGRDQMVPEFSKAAFATPPGQFTKEPVKTQFGWHVIKVEDHRTKPPPSFEEAKPELRSMIAREVVTQQLADLRKGAKIETFGLDGKPMPAPASK